MDNLRVMPTPGGDAGERRLALDVTRSWIVEAPAGSGKTGLLLQRYLALLASDGVTSCDEVLAITFTRAATEEIRGRLLEELRAAATDATVQSEYEATTRALARAVVERDRRLSWGLLEDPRRLRVQTIDALCAEIARSLPVLRRGASGLTPIENPEPLYRQAARRTLLRLGLDQTEADRRLSRALRVILLHRDGDLAACETLLAEMLASREQWGKLLPLGLEEQTDEELDLEVRPKLDRALEGVVCDGLSRLLNAFPASALDALAGVAGELALALPHDTEGEHPFSLCRDLVGPPTAQAEFLDHWKALLRLLLTQGRKFRKSFSNRLLGVHVEETQVTTIKEVIAAIADRADLLEEMERCLDLPPASYPTSQWVVAKPLLRVLHRAAFELEQVFAEEGACDFVAPALLARAALELGDDRVDAEQELSPSTLPASSVKHLLVDEMQDTSSAQYELLERLTAGWDGRTRTVFLVGDPKQSIYLFRQARVERFMQAMESKTLGNLPLGLLRLTANFRSRKGLVNAANITFREVFSCQATDEAQVEYTPAVAARGLGEQTTEGYAWHVTEVDDDGRGRSATAAAQAREDAKMVRQWIEAWVARPLSPERREPWRVAVLVQNRRSLEPILRELREGAPLPYRAVQIESLAERREILDLLALTRALLHPSDRIAWLAVLHAPWCGLGVSDLHVLTGADAPEFARHSVLELMAERGAELGAASIARLERVWPVLQSAVRLSGELRVPELVERTWRSLGGNTYLTPAESENANTFLELLRSIDREAGDVTLPELEGRLKRLYAAPTAEHAQIDVMTIHGAKGLEWDAVIVPELERAAPHRTARLLEWEELSSGRGVILAPITGKGEESEALHRWLRRLHATREKAERKRLFYVACTRAREELHLVGTVVRGRKELTPRANSLLEVAWPAAEHHVRVASTTPAEESEQIGLSLAAAADSTSDLEQMLFNFEVQASDVQERPAMLARVPADFRPFEGRPTPRSPVEQGDARQSALVPEHRPEGSFAARAFGNVVHAALELAASRFADGLTEEQVRHEAGLWAPRYRTLLRAEGLAPREVETQTERVRVALERTLASAVGVWILRASAQARAELPMTTWNEQRDVYRVDRVFLGGPTPGAEGTSCRWIIDYKTAVHGREGLDEFLDREQQKYRDQMERYAASMGDAQVCVGLWFPLLSRLRWWTVSTADYKVRRNDGFLADTRRRTEAELDRTMAERS